MKAFARWLSKRQFSVLHAVVGISFGLFVWDTQVGFGWVVLAAVVVGFLTEFVGVLLEAWGNRP